MPCALRTLEGRRQAASTVISGSNPVTFIPSLIAVSATMLPIAPRPMIPSVRPGSSTPANCFFPSSTSRSKSGVSGSSDATYPSAGITFRAAMSNAARTSSFTALAFAPGALNTGAPRFDISATGMLLVPAPARLIARTLAGIAISCMLRERTRIPVGRSIASPTEYRVSGKRRSPMLAIGLSVRI